MALTLIVEPLANFSFTDYVARHILEPLKLREMFNNTEAEAGWRSTRTIVPFGAEDDKGIGGISGKVP